MQGYNEKSAVCNPKEGSHQNPTLIWDFQPSALWEIKVCCKPSSLCYSSWTDDETTATKKTNRRESMIRCWASEKSSGGPGLQTCIFNKEFFSKQFFPERITKEIKVVTVSLDIFKLFSMQHQMHCCLRISWSRSRKPGSLAVWEALGPLGRWGPIQLHHSLR